MPNVEHFEPTILRHIVGNQEDNGTSDDLCDPRTIHETSRQGS